VLLSRCSCAAVVVVADVTIVTRLLHGQLQIVEKAFVFVGESAYNVIVLGRRRSWLFCFDSMGSNTSCVIARCGLAAQNERQ
jgi:hypothetical protein